MAAQEPAIAAPQPHPAAAARTAAQDPRGASLSLPAPPGEGGRALESFPQVSSPRAVQCIWMDECELQEGMWRPSLSSLSHCSPAFSTRPCARLDAWRTGAAASADVAAHSEDRAPAPQPALAIMVRRGEAYQGTWRKAARHGMGVWRSTMGDTAGDVYDGEWRDDKFDGLGTYTYGGAVPTGTSMRVAPPGDLGDTYVGEWRDGVKHGHGVSLSQASGDRYEGTWRANKQHGLGTHTWSNGAEYQGAFAEGVVDGQGHFASTKGYTLTGSFVRGRPTEGVMLETASQNRFFCTFGPTCAEIDTDPEPVVKVEPPPPPPPPPPP